MTNAPEISVIIPAVEFTQRLIDLLATLDNSAVQDVVIVFPRTKVRAADIEPLRPNIRIEFADLGRGSQIQKGIESTHGEIIWVLHSDSEIEDAAIQDIQSILDQSDVSLGCFRVKFRSPSNIARIFERVARWDSLFTTFGDQGYFFRRRDWEATGLDLADFPLMEDIELRRALRQRGRVVKSRLPLTTSANRFEANGFWRAQVSNFILICRYMKGAKPAELYAQYYGDERSERLVRNKLIPRTLRNRRNHT